MKRKFLKKAAAVLTASLLGVSTLSSGVLASESISEAGKKALETNTAEFAEAWDTALAKLKEDKPLSVNAEWDLVLAEAGKGLVGMLTGGMGIDISWFQGATILQSQTQSLSDGQAYTEFEILLNDNSIVHLNMLYDLNTFVAYMNVPELSDSWLMVNLAAAMEETYGSVGIDPQMIFQMINLLKERLPDGQTIANLVNRYGSLIFDNLQAGEAVEDTITAGGVTQNLTALEGVVTINEFAALLKSVFATAREDEELKTLVNSFADLVGEEDLFSSLVAGMDSTEANIDQSDLSEMQDALEAHVYAFEDADGNCKGLYATADVEGQPFDAGFYLTEDGDQRGLLLEGYFGEEYAGLEGSGTVTDGVLEGTYYVYYNDLEMIQIDVSNYAADKEANTYTGTFHISAVPQELAQSEDGSYSYDPVESIKQTLNMLSSFDIELSVSSTGAGDDQTQVIGITVFSADAPLATLTLTAAMGEGPAVPDASALGTVYDVENEEDMGNFVSNMDLGAVMNNLITAGVPETLINQLLGAEVPAA